MRTLEDMVQLPSHCRDFLCGFVAYMHRKDFDRALVQMAGEYSEIALVLYPGSGCHHDPSKRTTVVRTI